MAMSMRGKWFKKNIVSTILLLALAMGLLTGCTQDAAQDDAFDEAGTVSDSHSLSVMLWDESFNAPALRAAEADYREHVDPEFTLEITIVTSSDEVQESLSFAGEMEKYENLSDIVLYQDHAFQRSLNAYPDLWIPFDSDAVNWNDFSAEKLSYSTYDGVHYGVPVDNGTVVCAYRVDCLEAAGYSIDSLTGCTWDQFIEIGEAVYNETGMYLVAMMGDENDLFQIMLQAEGVSTFKDGEPYLAENETLIRIMNLVDEMLDRNVLLLTEDWSAYREEAIRGNMVAGVINGNWILPTIMSVEENSGKWAITTMPTLSGIPGYSSNGGSSLYITRGCENRSLAEDFLSYTFGGSTETYDRALRDAGVVTTCISAGQSDVYAQEIPYFGNEPVYEMIVEYSTHVIVIETNDYHYACRDELSEAIMDVHERGYSVEEALQEAEDNLRQIMGL